MKLIFENWKKFIMKEASDDPPRRPGWMQDPVRIPGPGSEHTPKSVEETAKQFHQRKAAERLQGIARRIEPVMMELAGPLHYAEFSEKFTRIRTLADFESLLEQIMKARTPGFMQTVNPEGLAAIQRALGNADELQKMYAAMASGALTPAEIGAIGAYDLGPSSSEFATKGRAAMPGDGKTGRAAPEGVTSYGAAERVKTIERNELMAKLVELRKTNAGATFEDARAAIEAERGLAGVEAAASQTDTAVDRLRRAMQEGNAIEKAMDEVKKGKGAANDNVLREGGIDPVTGKPRMGVLAAAYFAWLGTEVVKAGFDDYFKKAIGHVTGNEEWKNIETKSFYEIPLEMQERVWHEFAAIAYMPVHIGDYLTATFYKNLGQPPADAGLARLAPQTPWGATGGDLRGGRPIGPHQPAPRQPWTPETVAMSPNFQAGAEEAFLGSEEAARRWAKLAGFEPTETHVPRGKAGTTVYGTPRPPEPKVPEDPDLPAFEGDY
jgi:hypothetical protein